ncbi:MAG: aromatic ring-hydroxylating dioxygenase subunit alpha [Mesorhizobium sp.]|uniref:aromatic ring-hydroxylating oxygenase subunit alpha n=1 Tax=unclassified Mesorhizobium TaxID=325217 RepID=UPI000BB01EB2|nr:MULTISPECIES: aromatic ring-hydroxylating dioxygenase subunit alpha [unclassified Mesorhizobium]PBB41514.1 ring-hydroxylating oxygenase subunit alpha [Mesorhizobium sp. WSM3866]RWG60676.1 MAG: aromatic ring-hydroxylating dioxygenase subunit alpha [Mesorhizobium sp.]RWH30905.1 MAG: aromatic ring-hydroxylating dioxygenase subunit alpha [Mesorhizobium sp.]RWH34264.1 MAG: aromatic ring-hydroxylating dioxygenase subunit alpha [Mesorhizobium sp.]RWH44252.1 MAG: aromatic ring-hydroxylating dioxyge
MQPNPSEHSRYNGLTSLEPTLPASAYREADAYRLDLEAIWYRSWLMVCREADLAEPLAFRTARIGSQQVVVLRDETGSLRAFHNTCRHRGSQLCQESEGRLKARLLTCPYHAWSYSLRGDLVRVPSKSLPEGFDKDNYPLYGVALSVWRGFVFINLAVEPDGSAEASFDSASRDLSNWPLETLVPGHRLTKVMNCNWKIFWENFNECLHCPGVHKDLSRLVPIYGRGLMARHDDPEWARYADNDAPEFSGGLRAGAETWSRDGRVHGPVFAGLTPAERAAGQTYATSVPSMFVVGHVDYVRTVRLAPLGPEQTELTAEWLFAPDALAQTDIDNIVAFGTQVLEEDAAICEINQKGLHSIRHQAGVLMPEEYDLRRFHEWVRGRHAALQPIKTTSADSAK